VGLFYDAMQSYTALSKKYYTTYQWHQLNK